MAETSESRNAPLDLLRLFAALAVVGFHYFFRGAAGGQPMMDVVYPTIAPIAIFGYLGVNLFFLISGYVIALSAESRTALDFGLARFVRIYPGFLICMSISFLVLLAAGMSSMPVNPSQFFANLAIFAPAFGQPFVDGVYWSIVIELIFYGWIALAIVTGVFSAFRLEFIAAMLVVSAVNEAFIGGGALRTIFVTEFAPLFALGMLAQFIQARGASVETGILALAAFILSFAHLTITRDWMSAHYGMALTNHELVAANMVILLLFVAGLASSPLIKSTAVITAIGGLTYPLYLLHQNIGYVLIPSMADIAGPTAAALFVTASMIVVSWLIWLKIERPLQHLFKRFAATVVASALSVPYLVPMLRPSRSSK